jgi:hypothetical protein
MPTHPIRGLRMSRLPSKLRALHRHRPDDHQRGQRRDGVRRLVPRGLRGGCYRVVPGVGKSRLGLEPRLSLSHAAPCILFPGVVYPSIGSSVYLKHAGVAPRPSSRLRRAPRVKELGTMRGDDRVLDYLNRSLRSELTAINQYWLHYRIFDNWGYKDLAKKWREESAIGAHQAARRPALQPKTYWRA